jgi:tripartite-type tricarboxylate transporter receptor subunit TctC
MMSPTQFASADIRAGTLVALGVTIKNRSSLLPKVPTIAEAGVVGYDFRILVRCMSTFWNSRESRRQVSDGHRGPRRLCANGLQSTVLTR